MVKLTILISLLISCSVKNTTNQFIYNTNNGQLSSKETKTDTVYWSTPILDSPKVIAKFDIDSLYQIKNISKNLYFKVRDICYDFDSLTFSDSIKIKRRRNISGGTTILTNPDAVYFIQHNEDTLLLVTYIEEELFQGNYPQYYSSLYRYKWNKMVFLKNFYTISQGLNFIGYFKNRKELFFLSFSFTDSKNRMDVFSYHDNSFIYRSDITVQVVAEDVGYIVIKIKQ
jgi:hypothetical protein